MKRNSIITGILVAVGIVAFILLVVWYASERPTTYIQGEVEVTSIKISSKLTGRIEELSVKQGQSVRRGDLLYVVSTPEVDAKLRQAEAARTAAQAQSNKAQRGAHPQEIQAAYDSWQTAEAANELATRTHQRVLNLYHTGVVPRQQLDEAEAALKSTRSMADAARSAYELAREGARPEDKAAANALVDQASGAIDEVESYKADSHQYAPIDGEIGSLIAEQGELINAGYPVITLLDFSDMWITFNVKEDLLPKIQKGTQMSAYVTALDRTIPVVVDYLGVQADYATWSATKTRGDFDIRTFEVRARTKERVPDLRPGMTVVVNWNEL